MGLLTDDCDLNQNELETFIGGNGDYYIAIKADGKSHAVRIATSGGIAPLDVKLAIANLHRQMEAAGLNSSNQNNKPLVKADVSGSVCLQCKTPINHFSMYENKCLNCGQVLRQTDR